MPFRITKRSMLKRPCILLLLVPLLACSGSETETLSPAAPSPAAPSTLTTFTLSGQVIASRTRLPISEATVSVTYGSDAGRFATTDTSGNFSFTGMQQSSLMLGSLPRNTSQDPFDTGETDTNDCSRPARTGDPAFRAGDRRRHFGADCRRHGRHQRQIPHHHRCFRKIQPHGSSRYRRQQYHVRVLPTGMNLILDTFEGIRRRIFAYVASSEFSGGSHGL